MDNTVMDVIGIVLLVCSAIFLFKSGFAESYTRKKPVDAGLFLFGPVLSVPLFIMTVLEWNDPNRLSYIGTGEMLAAAVLSVFLITKIGKASKSRIFAPGDLLLLSLMPLIITLLGIYEFFGFEEALILILAAFTAVLCMRMTRRKPIKVSKEERIGSEGIRSIILFVVFFALYTAGTYCLVTGLLDYAVIEYSLKNFTEQFTCPAFVAVGGAVSLVVATMAVKKKYGRDAYIGTVMGCVATSIVMVLAELFFMPFSLYV